MPTRPFSAERIAVFTEGSALGFVRSMSGGGIKGEVATHNMGPDNFAKKQLAGIRYEDITVETDMGMGVGWYDWIRQSFEMSGVARSGEIVAADFDYKALRAIVFGDALITKTTIPALDAHSTDPVSMTITLHPEHLRPERRNGERLKGGGSASPKKWLGSNFKVEIGDLPCEHVVRVDPFTLKRSVVTLGRESRDPTSQTTKVEFPNLKITFSASDAEPWEDWFQSFVIDGKCTDGDELSGQIRFLGPDQQELGRIELSQVGIFSLQPIRHGAGRNEVAAMVAELYVEEMKLRFDGIDT